MYVGDDLVDISIPVCISVATGGQMGATAPPTVLGLDPEIRTDPLRSVKV